MAWLRWAWPAARLRDGPGVRGRRGVLAGVGVAPFDR